MKFLLDNGARVNDVDEKRKTALHFAAEHGATEIATMLIAKCAILNPKDETMRTPLHDASKYGE